MQPAPPPRLYGIHAAHAPIVAVFRRGPTNWWNILKWDYQSGIVERGAWFRGKLYPRRSSLSPDGMYLFTFILKHPGWDMMRYQSPMYDEVESPGTWSQMSRLPWLTALAAWPEVGTWTTGYRFTAEHIGEQRHWGDVGSPLHLVPGVPPWTAMEAYKTMPLAVERSRGWKLERNGQVYEDVIIRKDHPDRSASLYASVVPSFGIGIESYTNAYRSVRDGREPEPLTDAAWADWAHDGRLLVATINGQLQVRSPSGDGWAVEWSMDTCGWAPDPQPSPEWARRW